MGQGEDKYTRRPERRLAAVSRYWAPLAATGHRWALLGTAGRYWAPLARDRGTGP